MTTLVSTRDPSLAAWRAAEGLAPPERGHHQGQAQAADGGLGRHAAPLRARRQAAQTPAAAQHDILSASRAAVHPVIPILLLLLLYSLNDLMLNVFFPEPRLYVVHLPAAAHMTMPSMSL